MDPLLPILIPVTALAVVVFAFALCRAAARADAIESHQGLESGQDSSERAVGSAMATALSLAGAESHSPAAGERPVKKVPVFLVDEQGGPRRRYQQRGHQQLSDEAWSLDLWGAGGDHRRPRRQDR